MLCIASTSALAVQWTRERAHGAGDLRERGAAATEMLGHQRGEQAVALEFLDCLPRKARITIDLVSHWAGHVDTDLPGGALYASRSSGTGPTCRLEAHS